MIGIHLLKNTDIAFSTWDVDPFSTCIVVHLVGILHTGERGHGVTRTGFKDSQARRFMGGHK